jgi:DNA-binding protein H-NS
MAGWEYRKIGLNQHGPRDDDLALLNAAGAEGWELIGISSNNIAYLKRKVDGYPTQGADAGHRTASDPHRNGQDARTGEVKPKYRDPVTGETWSGRGRMATWLKRKQDAGESIDQYLIDTDVE